LTYYYYLRLFRKILIDDFHYIVYYIMNNYIKLLSIIIVAIFIIVFYFYKQYENNNCILCDYIIDYYNRLVHPCTICDNNKKVDIIIYYNKLVHMTCLNLKYILEDIGFRVVISDIFDLYTNTLYIIPLAQVCTKMPKNYIIYQLEQVKISKLITDSYLLKIKNSLITFDYNILNIQNIAHDVKHKLTFQPIPILKTIQTQDNYEYDILFCGGMNKRRTNIINFLKTKYKIKVCNYLYGNDLYNIVSKSKIIVNIHFYENAILETVRLNETLGYSNIIISEMPNINDKSYLEYLSIVEFIDIINDDLSNINNLTNAIDYNLANFYTIIKTNKNTKLNVMNGMYNTCKQYLIHNLKSINYLQ